MRDGKPAKDIVKEREAATQGRASEDEAVDVVRMLAGRGKSNVEKVFIPPVASHLPQFCTPDAGVQ